MCGNLVKESGTFFEELHVSKCFVFFYANHYIQYIVDIKLVNVQNAELIAYLLVFGSNTSINIEIACFSLDASKFCSRCAAPYRISTAYVAMYERLIRTCHSVFI